MSKQEDYAVVLDGLDRACSGLTYAIVGLDLLEQKTDKADLEKMKQDLSALLKCYCLLAKHNKKEEQANA